MIGLQNKLKKNNNIFIRIPQHTYYSLLPSTEIIDVIKIMNCKKYKIKLRDRDKHVYKI